MNIAWGIIFGNLTVVCFNMTCTACMRYGNWAYRIFKNKYIIPIYSGIYIVWITFAYKINLYMLISTSVNSL